MTQVEFLRESEERELPLGSRQAEALALAGKRLASKKAWWGEEPRDEDELKTVISVQPRGGGRYGVRVIDAVGVVAVNGLELVINPKIPVPHLLHLFGRSGHLPRTDEQAARSATTQDLWELVATWFTAESERVLRVGLVMDYEEVTGTLPHARGQLDTLQTAGNFYSGRLEFSTRYEEFGPDTALNRMIQAAARVVMRDTRLSVETRRRARRITSRLDGVGELRPSDLRSQLDRRTAHYRDACSLARNILLNQGRSISTGSAGVWSFLLRTPETVEAGIRAILNEALGEGQVVRRGVEVEGGLLKFTPDLTFHGPLAVADVKYKVSGGTWVRSDVYQAVTFAEAVGVRDTAVVRFRRPGTARAKPTPIGKKYLTELTWTADDGVLAEDAATTFVAEVTDWLADVAARIQAPSEEGVVVN